MLAILRKDSPHLERCLSDRLPDEEARGILSLSAADFAMPPGSRTSRLFEL